MADVGHIRRVAHAACIRLVAAIGDGVALLCANRAEFVETYYAVMRIGARLTPINWHLTGDEAGYIVDFASGGQSQSSWVEGEPEASIWTGLRIKDLHRIPVPS